MESSPAGSVGSLSDGVSFDWEEGARAAAASSGLEVSDADEGDALLGEGARRGSGRRCGARACRRAARAAGRPAVLKTGALLAVLLAALVLFARLPDRVATARLHAVARDAPLALVWRPSPAALLLQLQVQAASARVPAGTRVAATVLSGRACGGNANASACTLGVLVAPEQRAAAIKTVALDRRGPSFVNVTTDSDEPVAISLQVTALGYSVGWEVLFAAIVLVGVYVLIIFEVVHRTLAAMVGAFAALALLANLHDRPSFETVLTWVDWETVGLLWGMMILVGLFSTTGFFEFAAVRMYKLSGGHLWRLLSMLCFFTAILSAFLDNVTTILLLTPVTMQLCHVLDLEPVLIILSLVFFSNVGGTATAIGDPPNIIIVSDSALQAAEPGAITFGTMTLHLMPGVVLCLVATWFIVRAYFHARVDRQPSQAIQNELLIWRRTVSRVGSGTPEEQRVKDDLLRHIATLERAAEEELKMREVREVDIGELEARYRIKDWPLLINASLILGITVMLFFLHSFVEIHLTLAWIANIGAMALMLASGTHDIEAVLEHVEWATLVFFAALFIMMEALDELGLIKFLGLQVSALIQTVPSGGSGQLAAAVTIVIWVAGIGSAFIDNVPFTTSLIPVIIELAGEPLNLPIGPLAWALAFGACLGGNGTLVGASANLVAAGMLETAGHHVTFGKFFRRGMPITLATLAIANAYLLIFHVAIPWY